MNLYSTFAAVAALAAALAGVHPAGASTPSSTAASAAAGTEPCVTAADTLCLAGGRFRLRVEWAGFQGGHGAGTAVPLTADTGAFWFFRDSNLELIVKVLDGRAVNGHWWVFYGSLSNVGYTLTVDDLEGGGQRVYTNPAGTFASRGDTDAFAAASAAVGGSAKRATARGRSGAGTAARRPPPASSAAGTAARRAPPAIATEAEDAPPGLAFCQRGPVVPPAGPPPAGPPGPVPGCATGGPYLCLGGGRFRVEVDWEGFQGGVGRGEAKALSDDTGTFWFFRPNNVELMVKVLDGRPVNGRWWVFFGALSNVGYRVTVTDTRSGRRRTYLNPAGTFASRGDTDAFADAPLTGYGFSPRYFASVDRDWTAFANVRPFFAELDAAGDGVWALTRPWWEIGDDGAALVAGYDGLIGDYPHLGSNLVAAVQFVDLATGGPRPDPAAGEDGTWADWDAHGDWGRLTDAAVRMAARYRPPFLSVGVEINPFARNFPAEFATFAGERYPELVRRVCEVSPDTVVFPGFQFERMIGDLHGVVGPDGQPGCAGCVPFDQLNSLSGATYPAMGDVLDLFPPELLSHVGFTTYPYYNRDLATPADVPDDYYRRLYAQVDADHRGFLPVFTESAWPANATLSPAEACSVCALVHPEASPTCFPEPVYAPPCDAATVAGIGAFYADWLGGEDEQAAWAARYRQLTGDLGSPLALWLLLHDADPRNPAVTSGLFAHTGLRTHDGSAERPAYGVWTGDEAP